MMTPEYLEELANLADPDQLWRLGGFAQLDLPANKRRQLDAGVALRRHASHVRRLNGLLVEGKSLLITPLTPNSTATDSVATPARHRKLREAWPRAQSTPQPADVRADQPLSES